VLGNVEESLEVSTWEEATLVAVLSRWAREVDRSLPKKIGNVYGVRMPYDFLLAKHLQFGRLKSL
jgi:hypothetical protein